MSPGEVCERLSRVRALAFVARSANPHGWNGKGSGAVVTEVVGDGVVVFTESGLWRPEGGRELRFRNVFRWSAVGEALRLEHLRFVVAHPVFLFDLAPVAAGEWRSVSPHL